MGNCLNTAKEKCPDVFLMRHRGTLLRASVPLTGVDRGRIGVAVGGGAAYVVKAVGNGVERAAAATLPVFGASHVTGGHLVGNAGGSFLCFLYDVTHHGSSRPNGFVHAGRRGLERGFPKRRELYVPSEANRTTHALTGRWPGPKNLGTCVHAGQVYAAADV